MGCCYWCSGLVRYPLGPVVYSRVSDGAAFTIFHDVLPFTHHRKSNMANE